MLKISRRFIIVRDLNCRKFSLIENIYQVFGNFLVLGTKLNQFAIRNSQFAITFCDGDLDPDTKRAAYRGRGLKPPKFVKRSRGV
ncbi:hypothetical protein ANSO36C_11970 [Nostoc cf. commune SO-36]|uniref:Uncharacterized protein n=1 Tax=Nostoc cf. commune SO-36 TaxID=449208 RepID=A0ABN6PZ72_NOSCO|nr:hypothetical protein ANSO36C_11970 [Nostoc cf. commune SO-36]